MMNRTTQGKGNSMKRLICLIRGHNDRPARVGNNPFCWRCTRCQRLEINDPEGF